MDLALVRRPGASDVRNSSGTSSSTRSSRFADGWGGTGLGRRGRDLASKLARRSKSKQSRAHSNGPALQLEPQTVSVLMESGPGKIPQAARTSLRGDKGKPALAEGVAQRRARRRTRSLRARCDATQRYGNQRPSGRKEHAKNGRDKGVQGHQRSSRPPMVTF